MGSRDEWVEAAKSKLDEWNTELDRLEEKARSAKREREAQYQRAIANLERKRAEVRDKVAEIQEAGDSAWDELRDGARESLKVLSEAFRAALEEIRRSESEEPASDDGATRSSLPETGGTTSSPAPGAG